MKSKTELKKFAIQFRQKGLTYSEILEKVPVAKSTLSLWLRGVNLSKKLKQRLTKKKLEAALRGGEARRRQRIEITKKIHYEAQKEVGKISKRELWLIGTALYWAEGSKEKKHNPGSGVEFSNSDPYMVKLFLEWLTKLCKVEKKEINLGLYIHENSKGRLDEVINRWSVCTGFPKYKFTYVYFKKNKIKTTRKNIGDSYYGNLKVGVKASSSLNRKIAGWIQGINKNY